MAIDFIFDRNQMLPTINADRVKEKGLPEVTDYLIRLVRTLQEDLLRTVVQVINIQLSIMNVGVFNFNLPDANGSYTDNSWRFMLVGTGVELQKKVSGTWEKVSRWEF